MRIITGFIGRLLMVLALILTVPLLFAVISREIECIEPFLYAAAGSAVVGILLFLTRDRRDPTTAQAMSICTLSWLTLSVAGSIPFVFIIDAGWVDAIFETMSGFTTTGITMFTGLDDMPASIILWRSLTEWVGGLGILTFFLAVASKVPGAHKLMGAESSKIFSGRPVPGLMNTVKILWSIYSLFTVAVALALYGSGMGLMDSINHSLTTISTGGFSPHDASIGWYQTSGTGNYILIEYILIAGMLAGGTSFLVHYRFFRGQGLKALFSGTEARLWWTLIGLFTGIILIERHITAGISYLSLEEAFRKSLFHVSSIISATGFVTENLYSPFFGTAARLLFLVMMVTGGCVGSTSGGFKMLRVSVLWKVAEEEVKKIFRSGRAISGVRMEGDLVDRSEISRIAAILFLWVFILLSGGLITALLSPGISGLAAYSGIFSALGNTGPSLMTTNQMINLHWGVKITYIFAMLAGRLEILPVLLLFSRKSWK